MTLLSPAIKFRLDIIHPSIIAAVRVGVASDMIRALVLTENANIDIFARRTEPGFYAQYIDKQPQYLRHAWYGVPEVISASYGLTQIMFTTAEWISSKAGIHWSGEPWDLFAPNLNLRLGSAVLADKIAKYGERDGVAAYNSGKPRKDVTGRLLNERYVARFEGYLGRALVKAEEGV